MSSKSSLNPTVTAKNTSYLIKVRDIVAFTMGVVFLSFGAYYYHHAKTTKTSETYSNDQRETDKYIGIVLLSIGGGICGISIIVIIYKIIRIRKHAKAITMQPVIPMQPIVPMQPPVQSLPVV